MRRLFVLGSAFLLVAGCAAQPAAEKAPIAIVRSQVLAPQLASDAQPTDEDAAQEKLLADAWLAINTGLARQAIDTALDPIIATFEERWDRGERRVYSARTAAEAGYYMIGAAARHESSVALGPVWAEAYKSKAYALLDLGRKEDARAMVDKALRLAPENAAILEELGAQYEAERNWPLALATFQHAERAAQDFSPDVVKNDELARAWRGIAFVYTETGKLDEAEALYKRCLALNGDDQAAARELRYVNGLRAKKLAH